MTRLLVPLSLLGVLVVAASACGGSSEPPTTAEFSEAVVTTRDRVDFTLARIPKATSVDDFLARMNDASRTIDDAAADLDHVGAPQRYAEPAGRLVAALDQLSVDLAATASDLSQPELLPNLVTGAQGINFDSWDDANRALADLRRLGIKVELIARH